LALFALMLVGFFVSLHIFMWLPSFVVVGLATAVFVFFLVWLFSE
jgi:hypothetical protein